MKIIKTICLGTLLTGLFAVSTVSRNTNVNLTKADDETTVYDLKTDFAAEVGSWHDINAWGTPWGVEAVNIAELFKDGQGINLEDSDARLPEYDESSEWSASTLSLYTYPMFNNSSMTELGGYFNQYPEGWKMIANANPGSIQAWPAETGYRSADTTYLKYFHVAGAFHPGNGAGVTVYFTAPKTGNIKISDSAYINNTNSDGTYFFIYKIPAASFISHTWSENVHHGLFGGSPIYPEKGVSPTSDWSTWEHIPNYGTLEYETDEIPVEEGDVIAWIYGGGSAIDYDLTYTSPKVTYVSNHDSIELSESSLNLCKGETKALTASVYPGESAEKGITWTSSDDSVASVTSDGLITGKSDGTAVIKATLNDGTPKEGEDEVSATCTVTVSGGESVKITNKASSLTVMQGETLNLTYETYPQTNVIEWSVESGDGIASVDSEGVVTGLNAGTAVIRATVSGTETYDEVSVTVTAASAPVLTLSNTDSIDIQPGETYQIETSITPKYHQDKSVIVTTEDPSIATASWENGVITLTAVAQGSTVLYATVLGGNTVMIDVLVSKHAVKTYEWKKDFTNPMPSRWEHAMISDGVYNTDLIASEGRWGYSYETRQDMQGLAYVDPDIEYFSIFGGQGVHPLVGHQACVAFVVPNEGTIDYSSHFVTQNAASAQQFRILMNDTQIYPTVGEWQSIDASHPDEVYLPDIQVKPGDKIYAIVDSGTSDSADFCFIDPIIKYTEMVGNPEVVTIDKTEITLNVGEYVIIQATVDDVDYRTRKLTWSTSNERVAAVNQAGEVTALHSGTAIISVTLEGGNTVTCTVHVNRTQAQKIGIIAGSAGGAAALIAGAVVLAVVLKKKKAK